MYSMESLILIFNMVSVDKYNPWKQKHFEGSSISFKNREWFWEQKDLRNTIFWE